MKNIKFLNLKPLLSAILFLTISTMAFSQGSAKYIPIDQVNESHVDKEIRLDFRSSARDVSAGNIQSLSSSADKVMINLFREKMQFAEVWKVAGAQASLSDQLLQSTEEDAPHTTIIKEVFLLSVDDSTLKLKVHAYPLMPGQSMEFSIEQSEPLEIEISRASVKGLLM